MNDFDDEEYDNYQDVDNRDILSPGYDVSGSPSRDRDNNRYISHAPNQILTQSQPPPEVNNHYQARNTNQNHRLQ